MTKVIIENPVFVLFLTGSAEKISFEEKYDFELAKKEAEESGDGFKSWVEVERNNESLIISLDY